MAKKVTIYPLCTKTLEPHHVEVEYLVNRIRNGKSKETVELVRSSQNETVSDFHKRQLPAYSWSGTFRKRADDGLIEHSGLFCLDLDDLTAEQLKKAKADLKKDKYTHILFVSPSGCGLKLVCKIQDALEWHKDSGRGLFKHFGKYSFDKKQLDVSRLCFESFDEDVFYNPNSEVFTDLVKEEKPLPIIIKQTTTLTDDYEIIDRLKKWMEKRGEYFVTGNRNNYAYRLVCACNRFGVNVDIVYNMLISEYQGNGFTEAEVTSTIKNVYGNKKSEHGTAHFDKNETIVSRQTNDEIKIPSIDLTTTVADVIYVNDIADEMIDTFLNGRQTGTTTYFQTLDRHWTWKKGEITLMHGLGNDGKSTMITQLMLIKSVKEGTKWAIFSPEQYPPIDYYDDLIQTYIGKSTDRRYLNCMSVEEYKRGMEFVKEYFFYIFPETESPTPEYINTRFEECIVKHGVEGCLTDPYNQLENDIAKYKRDDLYISQFLTKKKRFVLLNNIYDLTVAHPNGSVQKDNNGEYNVPDYYDLAGGAMWANKMDNILCTHRPFRKRDPKNPTVTFYSQKIKKQKLVGKLGFIDLTYSFIDGRYYENIDGKDVSPFGLSEFAEESKYKQDNENPF